MFGDRSLGVSIFAAIALVSALVLSTATVSAASVDRAPILTPRMSAPTLPGAPFFPSAERTDLVLARLDLLTQRDKLNAAKQTLENRSQNASVNFGGEAQTRGEAQTNSATSASPVPASTNRILDSRIASVERQLVEIETLAEPLLLETAPFSIGIAVFPVAELRKPFFNDWGRPRSGGRSHRGTDMLAQIGVDLRAIEDGYVERIGNGSLGGLSIYLIGESGSRYYYAHLDEIGDVVEGQRVYAGQVVGTNGDSGNARGAPHLHMQWAPTGESNWENPFPLLDVLFGEGAAAEAIAAVDEVPSIDRSDDPYLFDGGS